MKNFLSHKPKEERLRKWIIISPLRASQDFRISSFCISTQHCCFLTFFSFQVIKSWDPCFEGFGNKSYMGSLVCSEQDVVISAAVKKLLALSFIHFQETLSGFCFLYSILAIYIFTNFDHFIRSIQV